jgi:hypothetical protein
MKCKNCKREIDSDSIFCKWCGQKQIREAKKEVRIPTPRQLPSGKWHIQLRIDGQSVYITEDTEAKCRAKAVAVKSGLIETRKKPENISLHDACLRYIAAGKDRRRPTTTQGYEKIVRNHFPDLMKKPIGSITSDLLQAAVDKECGRLNQRGQKYAPKTICSAYNFIAEVLSANHIQYDTPRLPELKRKPVQILTAEQVYKAVKGTEIELPCLLAMWMTFTISEIRGFTKSKSIRNGQISVVEAVVDIDGKPVRLEGGKEETRTRTHDIPPYIMELIDRVEGDVICPLSSQSTNKRLQRLLAKNDLPVISFHKLRHIAASTAAALGVPATYNKDRGGWKSDHIMNTVYTHTFTAERKAADELINSHFESIIHDENADGIKKS